MPYLGPPRAAQPQALGSHNVHLVLRQQPELGLVTLDNKEKGRKPIDPPPIIQMHVVVGAGMDQDTSDQWLVSPYLFTAATLLEGEEGENMVPGKHIIGQTSSSLHRLKDVTNKDGGFFVFGDLSIKRLGRHRIRFSLFNADQNGSTYITSIDSMPFSVVPSKEFRGLSESSHLSRTFSDQGVRLRLRKETRQLGSKRQWESPEDTTPPEAPAAAYSGSSAQYAHGTPNYKRQRSDYDQSTPYAYQQYSESTPRYYNNGGAPAGRTYGGQDQAYHQTQPVSGTGGMPVHDPYQNSHYGQHGAVQGIATPVAQSTATNTWSGSLPQSLPSASAGSSGDLYNRSTMTTRDIYFDTGYQQHTSAQYGAQVQLGATYQTPTSMTGGASQNAAYLTSNAGPGAVPELTSAVDSSLGTNSFYHSDPGSPWSSGGPASTQPIQSDLKATALPSTSSGSYYQQPYPSRYADVVTVSMSMADPYPIQSYMGPTSSSPLRAYRNSALGDSTLNSTFSAGGYPG
ncbi:hypothetical protein LTR36_005964 [Oleoguttula mirabilis]|uniref:Velvet domain-containing protein n=1 Tax=Oleoguttula mirabilis TaxID=1507867 RepID=A0AAV9JCT4_9PEZI|nr:hypothetical protein LTR36_005964 [Oleoguttula mirabilis]